MQSSEKNADSKHRCSSCDKSLRCANAHVGHERQLDLPRWRVTIGHKFQSFQGSVRQFCHAEGVSVASFYQWRQKLNDDSDATMAAAQAFAEDISAAQFVPLQLVHQSMRHASPSHAALVLAACNPDNLYACQTLVEQLVITVVELELKSADLVDQRLAQQLEIAYLIKLISQRRSERYLEDPSQLKLGLGNGDEVLDAAEGLQDAKQEQSAAAELIIAEHFRKKQSRTKKPRHKQQELCDIKDCDKLLSDEPWRELRQQEATVVCKRGCEHTSTFRW